MEEIISLEKKKAFAVLHKVNDINTQLARKNQLTYAKLYHPIRGKLINFKRFPYLVDIYEDTAKEIVVQKSGQCGISEYLVDETFFLSDNYKINGLYCFPAQSQLNAFSHARVESVIRQSEHLRELSGETNNVSLRDIGDAHVYFRGMQDMKQIIAVDADFLMLDEIDQMPAEYIPVVEKRLGGSLHKIKRYVSTPTYPDYGINAKFKEGDMREWFIKCEHCGYWQYLDFFKNVDLTKGIYICKKCKKKIDNLYKGKWVPRHRDREIHSYHISKLFSARATISELKKSFKDKAAIQHFFNFDLGLTYIVADSRLQKENLDSVIGNYDIKYNGNGCCMGVDVGADINLYITDIEGGEPKTLFVGTVKKFEELDRYMEIFNIKICVIDALPETRESKKFAKRFPGRVFLAYYPPMKQDVYFSKDRRDEVDILNINRTLSLDYMFNDFFMKKIKLPRNIETVEDFYDQMTSLTRVKETNRSGIIIAKYVEQGADHYAHARNYCRVAEVIQGELDAETMISLPNRRRDRRFSGGSRRMLR